MTAGRGTMLKAVENGLWYADGSIWFISGRDITDSTRIKKADYDAIYGSATIGSGRLSGKKELAVADDCVIFWTDQGVCIGGPDGEFFNLTEQVYHPKREYNGAHSVFRQLPGINQVVTILN